MLQSRHSLRLCLHQSFMGKSPTLAPLQVHLLYGKRPNVGRTGSGGVTSILPNPCDPSRAVSSDRQLVGAIEEETCVEKALETVKIHSNRGT